MSLADHVQNAIRNKAGLGGLFNPMQEETDAVMTVVEPAITEAELSGRKQGRDEAKESYLQKLEGLHKPFMYHGFMGQSERCDHCRHYWPCPTMKIFKDNDEH